MGVQKRFATGEVADCEDHRVVVERKERSIPAATLGVFPIFERGFALGLARGHYLADAVDFSRS